MDSAQQEKIATFVAVANCDAEFATSFLAANDWVLESAISNFMEPGSASHGGGSGGGGSAGSGSAGFSSGLLPDETERAPIAQFRDTLIEVDPAQRMPQRAPSASATNHPLEAFRDFRREGGSGNDVDGATDTGEVFGLTKRPKNLADIYRAPTELCFVGTFEELRAAGRMQQRWLLVNIQSPTEFASQQLNADTWRDETLQAVIKASFLFWQQVSAHSLAAGGELAAPLSCVLHMCIVAHVKCLIPPWQYYDSPDGATFCRYYLPGMPCWAAALARHWSSNWCPPPGLCLS